LADHGIVATTVHNTFTIPTEADADTWAAPASRRSVAGAALRQRLGVGPDERLALQPTRAIPRKNVAGGLVAAHALGATFWLLGPAEDGYGPELEELLVGAPCPVVRGLPDGGGAATIDDAYQACDVVALPSTWEGFGNPAVESATHRRPLVIGPYPVAHELAASGFRWFPLDDLDALAAWLDRPDGTLLEHNLAVAASHFSSADLPERLQAVLPPC
jgi:glycosyltransferase involved in cell wall biosynthesis